MHLTEASAFTFFFAILVTPISSQIVSASCKNALDVVFVVDGSNSVNPFNYIAMINNLNSTPDTLDLGPDWTRMGVVMFSAYQQLQVIPLQSSVSLLKAEIQQKLYDYPDTTTDTDKAVERATSLLLTTRRAGVPQVMVLVTDGQGNYPDRTLSQIRAARLSDIAILTVGMNYRQENLDMTIDPARDMFVLSEWNQVIGRLVELSAWYCPPPVCTQGVDLMFVLDGSNSVFYTNFEQMMNSVGNTSLAFWTSYNQSRIGLVVFSTTVTDIVPLTSDRAVFQNRLKMISYPDQGTFTWLGIAEASRQLLSVSNVLPKVMVVITDGDSENQGLTIQAADEAKARGITIYGIGVGTTINPAKLAEITSADAGQVKLVQDFGELTSNLTKLVSGMCHAPSVVVPKTNSTTPTDTIPACSRTVDVFFLMDTSDSAGSNAFAIMASGVARAARSFINGSGQVRLMAFSNNVTYNRGAIASQGGLDQALAELSSIIPSGSRGTDLALRQAATDIQDRMSGRRPGVPLAFLIILTGSSQRPADAAVMANLLVAQQGAKVFSLGITNGATDSELMSLTFNVPGRWVRAADYGQLPAVLRNVSATICATA